MLGNQQQSSKCYVVQFVDKHDGHDEQLCNVHGCKLLDDGSNYEHE